MACARIAAVGGKLLARGDDAPQAEWQPKPGPWSKAVKGVFELETFQLPVKNVYVEHFLVDVCGGNDTDALLLAQCLYWMEHTTLVRHAGHWFWKSSRAWQKELGIPQRTVVDSFDRLEKLGLIARRKWFVDKPSRNIARGKPVTHYQVQYAALHAQAVNILARKQYH